MKPKGKWKYADRIGLISLGYFNEPQNNFRDWTFKFLINREKKSILYDNYKFRNISGPVALWRNYEKKSTMAVAQENLLF